jgi:hypothetical protein
MPAQFTSSFKVPRRRDSFNAATAVSRSDVTTVGRLSRIGERAVPVEQDGTHARILHQ